MSLRADTDAEEQARLYRLQVRELEDFALFMTNPEGTVTTWNLGVERIFGYTENDWIGQHISVIFTEPDRTAGVVDEEMRTAAEQGRCTDIRWHVRKDGAPVYIMGVLRGLKDCDGKLMAYSKVFLDATAHKRLEDNLTQSNKDLEQFAIIASHDLQEPLRTISSFADLLGARYGPQLDADANKMLDFVVHAADRMAQLIRDLLAFSQIAGQETGVISVHLDEDLESAMSLLQAEIDQTKAVITHDPLPNIELERNQMVRLFQNLLGNALKFRKPGHIPHIHVSAELKGKEWVVRVADDGIGFPPEQAETIFKPFKRLHNTRLYPGSGVGLAVCHRIVEAYGGRIGADSTPGEGSIFWFTIPVSDQDQERLDAHPAPLRV